MQGMTTGMPLGESQATVPDRLRQQWLARLVPVPLPEGALRPSPVKRWSYERRRETSHVSGLWMR